MNEREKIAWLYRRVGFGLAPGQLDLLESKGVSAVLDELADPDGSGVPRAKDPWEGVSLPEFDPQQARRDIVSVIAPWLRAMVETTRPLEEWMRWFWHGHFVSTIAVVKQPKLMVGQLQLLGQFGLGDFRTLLRAVSIDPAMLVYLDGIKNKKNAVNENYGRELLELFGLGIGNYTEADVRAAAEALTGWGIDRGTGQARFAPRQHDDKAQTLLGRSGVHDLDTVIDAVVGHDACPRFIAGKLGRAILGPDVDPNLTERLAVELRSNGMQIRPLVRSILEAGLDGAAAPLVIAPVPWFTGAMKALGVEVNSALDVAGGGLVPAGQVPLAAPNVAGWPGGRNWLTSSATVARFNMASALADLTPGDSPAARAASAGDDRALADALNHPDGFGPASSSALSSVRGAGTTSVLTIALSSPELVLA